jgi:DnaJ-domain-containing protein 1
MNDQLSPVEKVLDRLEDYTERRGEYRARCPAHQGNSDNSLSIKEGDDGRALLRCHASCDLQDIVGALGLGAVDLFPHNGRPRTAAKKAATRKTGGKKILTTDELPDGTYWEFTSPSSEVLYIQRHKREYYRKVGEAAEGLWKKGLDGVSQVLYSLPALMDAVRAGETIYHLEGPKDVETAREKLGVVATTSGGVSTWRTEFKSFYTGADVVIVPDNDEPGRGYAEKVAQDLLQVARRVRVVLLPDLGEGEDLTDWLEAGHTKEEFFGAVEAAAVHCPEEEKPWLEPVPVEVRLPDVMEFDFSLLPSPLRAWVRDISERMDNAPPDFAAAAVIVVSATLLGRKVGIRPKCQDDWLVVPNLWGGLVGPPASMKTPALEQVIRPVKRLAAEAQEAYEEALKKHDLDMMVVSARRDAMQKKLKETAKKVAESQASAGNLEDIREEIEELEEPDAPRERRYMTNDATIEKIAEILRDNPDGILYYRDELMGWLRSLEKTGRESDRAFYLEAWNGSGSFSVDRIGRGSLHVPAVCVSILGGIQPGPLMTYVNDALEESEKADGLLQRFQVLVYPDLRDYDPVDRWPDLEAKSRAYDVFKSLASLDAESFGATVTDEEGEIPHVRFDAAAQEVFDAWRAEFEPRFRGGEFPAAIESHFMKFRSLFASLALIFEAVDFVGGVEGAGKAVSKYSALRAAAWCEFLESHAMRVYSPTLDVETLAAKTLLDRLHMGDVEHGAKVRDIYRKQWSQLTTPEEVAAAIEVLEEHGWVRLATAKPKGGGRPSEVLHIHPEIRE